MPFLLVWKEYFPTITSSLVIFCYLLFVSVPIFRILQHSVAPLDSMMIYIFKFYNAFHHRLLPQADFSIKLILGKNVIQRLVPKLDKVMVS